MNKQQEALKLALEALEYIHEGANNQGPHTGISWRCVSNKADPAITAIRKALADSALDRMAENARELGLDYEPPCKTGSQCTSKCQQCEQPAQQQEQIVAWITNGSLYGLRRTNKKTVVVHREKTKVACIPVFMKVDA